MSSPLADRVLAGDPRAIARAISLIENEDPRAPSSSRAHLRPDRPRVSDRRHRAARRGQEHARRSADRRASPGRGRQRSGVHRRRSDQPVQRRRRARRPAAHAGARVRRGRVHPQHGHARASGRPGAGHRRRRPRARRRRQGHRRSSRRSASARTRSTSSGPPTCPSSTLVPGTGDDVQALKAGIMEIADIFVVNKADREGADRLVAAIESILALQPFGTGRVAAADSEDRGDDRATGVPELVDAIWRFRVQPVKRRGASGAAAQRSAPSRARVAALHGMARAGRAGAGRVRRARRARRGARDRSVHGAADLLGRARATAASVTRGREAREGHSVQDRSWSSCACGRGSCLP